MKRILTSIVILAASVITLQAQQINGVELKRQGDWMSVKMAIDMADARPGSNETVILTPVLRNGNFSQDLKTVGVYSRNQWYYYRRNGAALDGENEYSFRKSKMPDVLKYITMVPYRN